MIITLGKRYKVVCSRYSYKIVMWVQPMDKYIGRVATVNQVVSGNTGWVRIDLDDGLWCWDVESFKECEMFSDKEFEL
jgi:hypothetical protein